MPYKALEGIIRQGAQEEPEGRPGGPGRGKRARGGLGLSFAEA